MQTPPADWKPRHDMHAASLDCLLQHGEDAIVRKDREKAADMFYELPLALVVYGYLHPVLPEDARLRVAKRIERIYMGCLGTLIGA